MGFFSRLVSGLTKTRDSIASGLDSIFSGFSKIDDEFYEELEEILIMGDLGVDTTMNIIEELQERVKEEKIKEPADCRQLLIDIIKAQMEVNEDAYEFEDRTSVVLVIGVNGVGKTTTIGKLASQLKARRKKVIMAAADTFRAAAIEQLTEWSRRAGVDIIAHQEGADPAAVVFDACQAARSRKADILLVDTAGRLHNKKNLMNELGKIRRVIEREFPEAYLETLIVLDSTTGQNAIVQAREFKEVTDVSGIVLTKLDGTAKGGIAIAIQAEMGIPVKYIGVGEQIDDLQKFDPDSFVNALFDRPGDDEEAMPDADAGTGDADGQGAAAEAGTAQAGSADAVQADPGSSEKDAADPGLKETGTVDAAAAQAGTAQTGSADAGQEEKEKARQARKGSWGVW